MIDFTDQELSILAMTMEKAHPSATDVFDATIAIKKKLGAALKERQEVAIEKAAKEAVGEE